MILIDLIERNTGGAEAPQAAAAVWNIGYSKNILGEQ
jgi:hypothetical protein